MYRLSWRARLNASDLLVFMLAAGTLTLGALWAGADYLKECQVLVEDTVRRRHSILLPSLIWNHLSALPANWG